MSRSHTLLLFGVAAALTALGWWQLGFLCDDAYIAFRYVRMAQLGHGYTWNPPPFRPVEGYTSWAWVALLDGTWRVTGAPPERSADLWSLAFSLVSVGLLLRLTRRLLAATGGATWAPVAAVALLAVCTNRTWLTWTSSGLETALWTAALLAWADAAFGTRYDRAALLRLIATAAALPLIRPDGLLYAACSPALALARIAPNRRPVAADAALLAPLLLPAAHALWRYTTYGAWLPNTYYAKVTSPWPLMGGSLGFSFLYEYALWPLILLGAVALRRVPPPAPIALAVAIPLAHLVFLLWGGGDHFGYRIFAHWVPLLWLGGVWATWAGGWRPARAAAALAALAALGGVLPWTHWAQTAAKRQGGFEHAHHLLAPSFPAPLRPLVHVRDVLGRWQKYHLVGTPHHVHVAFLDVQRRRFGLERLDAAPADAGLPIWAHQNPGYAAYHLPELYVIDLLGLNDAVIARTPPQTGHSRLLAHERSPPPGYVECFRPNVTIEPEGYRVEPRATPVDAATVMACEARWWEAVGLPPR